MRLDYNETLAEEEEEVEVVIYPLYMYLLAQEEGPPPSVGEPLKSSGEVIDDDETQQDLEKKTEAAIARATVSRLEYAVRSGGEG